MRLAPLVLPVSFALGLALIAAGCWMAWPPLAPITAGTVILAFGLTREAGK
jgi:hypothetical protein